MNDSVTFLSVRISVRSIWSTLGLVVLAGFTYLLFVEYIIPGLDERFKLESNTTILAHIWLMLMSVIGHLLIASNVCLAVNVFKPLKAWGEDGLIMELIGVSVFGLIAGLIVGLIVGLIGAIIVGHIVVYTLGLAMGLNAGLIVGLIMGLIAGFIHEFE